MAAVADHDEATFMTQLLQGLDDSFWSAVPSPDPSPVKQNKPTHVPAATPCTPTKSRQPAQTKQILSSTVFSADNHDITAFLEGSENWDLDTDPFSPIKSSSSKTLTVVKPQDLNADYPTYVPEPCTRCVVESVLEESSVDGWRKVIIARVEPGEERVDIYLYDDWYHTDIHIDDTLNVLGMFSAPQPSSSSSFPKRCISLTTSGNLLILHPDMLLTATALSNASQCRRKPLLTSLVRSTSDITPALVWGSMLHEVMQRCLLEQRWDEVWIDNCLHDAISRGLGELVKLGLSEEVALIEMRERAKGFKVFAGRYLGDVPKADAVLTNTRSGAFHEPSLLAISKLLDVEEDIWSPTYGLKGKLDATVLGVISEPVIPPSTSSSSSSSYYKPPPTIQERTQTVTPLPLELKTGRALAGMEHRAQTMLYTLLLSERYGVDVRDGLLYYTQSGGGEVVRVPRGRNEVRGLIGVRNELVGYMWRRVRRKKGKGKEDKIEVQVGDPDVDMEDIISPSSLDSKSSKHGDVEEPFLPPPIDDERACKRCYALDTCLLFRKAYSSTAKQKTKQQEHDPPVPAFLAPIFDLKTGHLTSTQTQFFKDWERLLALEEKDLVRFKRELWTLGAKEREGRGRCFGGMVLRGVGGVSGTKMIEQLRTDGEWGKESKIHRHTYRFVRSESWVMAGGSSGSFPSSSTFFIEKNARASPGYSPSSVSASSARSLLNGHLNIGDAITVSVEPNLLALARGFILDLTTDEVVLGVDHVLDLDAIRERLGRDKVQKHSASMKEDVGERETMFRIDKDELFGGMARVRNNLAQLFYADGDRRRLALVVDLRPPVFSPPALDVITSAGSPPSITRPTPGPTTDLNPSQLNAILHVLSAEDYALILGMPGTGKTTVIAELVRTLVKRGKTVLVASYTHSAVDTILMKLSKIGSEDDGQHAEGGGFGILRLGNVDKVHPDVRKYTLNAKRTAVTVEELERQLMSPPVVATTCLSIDHPLFSRRVFDYCIVDEASQITLPTCLGPLRFADKFVLVGDHNQLPPLVKNPEAREGGLDISLFRRLSDAHPEAVVDLRFQYRMNADIMLLSNRLIYNDRLKCGSEEVAGRCLKLSESKFLDRLHVGDTELCTRKTCWLERVVDESCKAVFIDTDALPAHDSRVGDLVQNTTEAELVRQLTETLLRSGVKEEQIGIISLYKQQVKLMSHLLDNKRGVEILTADKSQGRDKDCIVVSLVRSNEAGTIGDLVKDWRRMNVSFTRARSKLVIFGSRKTLQREPLLAQFFDLMESQGWILALPAGADVAHAEVFEGCSTPAKRSLGSGFGVPAGPVGEAGKGGGLLAEMSGTTIGKENGDAQVERPVKRLKAKTVQSVGNPAGAGGGSQVGKGVLKRRPILQDLIINES